MRIHIKPLWASTPKRLFLEFALRDYFNLIQMSLFTSLRGCQMIAIEERINFYRISCNFEIVIMSYGRMFYRF